MVNRGSWDPTRIPRIIGYPGLVKCHGEVTFLSLALMLSLASFHEGLVDVIGKLLVYIVFVLLVCGFAKWPHFCKETFLEKQ